MKTTETYSQEVTQKLANLSTTVSKKRWYKRVTAKRNHSKLVKYSLVAVNAVILLGVLAIVLQPTNSTPSKNPALLSTKTDEEAVVNPVDELSSADIAVNVARVTRIEEATSVANKADTVNAQLNTAPSNDVVAAAPQIIASSLKSRYDIQTYIVVKGDTIESIAEKFDISTDTIRWSNDVTDDQVKPGKKLIISPIDGIVYKVKSGDTAAELASKYSADKNKISVFNDFEIGAIPVGEYIVIPGGKPPTQAVVRTPDQAANSAGFAWGGFSPVYGNNGYDYGYCTWWAAARRAQAGRPIPSNLGNASTWKVLAQRAGLGVGNKPAAGAVIWTPPRDYYGHVGYVERVNSDGSILVSEMNTVGWGVASKKTLSASQAAQYGYIY